MRQVFCINGDVVFNHLMVAVYTSLMHNPFEIVVIYDQLDNDNVQWLKDVGVTVIHAETRFMKNIKLENKPRVFGETALRGSMLRLDIPHILDDDYVIYCDNDVMFLKSCGELSQIKPSTVAMTLSDANLAGYNDGVMVMNLNRLRSDVKHIDDMCQSEDMLSQIGPDEILLNEYYKGTILELDPRYNWRVFWGRNPAAKVIHFHICKPSISLPDNLKKHFIMSGFYDDAFEDFSNIWQQLFIKSQSLQDDIKQCVGLSEDSESIIKASLKKRTKMQKELLSKLDDDFDSAFYLNMYPDVAAAVAVNVGDSEYHPKLGSHDLAVIHWLSHGKDEHRIMSQKHLDSLCPNDFDWENYVDSNPDLIDCGITTEQLARCHWANYGRNEHRTY